MSTVIKVENLSKQYRLGNVGLGSLGADVNRWWHTRILGNEDPYLKIGEENNREVIGNSEYVWALRDINFEVEQGEVLGIIGRNGAGKSTLLKILSRTTGPTTGSIKIKGRVASLLEVGTGFHPELTGRENIFLNGAILGMTKDEIRRKFDEIVAFAGVERYVDTPVKRYSSGMYVRLAFAVAAHLEPEILIVDEVLAVGDAEFQKKAIGKMKEVSEGQGRTVLFVSHNMGSIRKLCPITMIMKNGRKSFIGNTEEAIEIYSTDISNEIEQFDFKKLLSKKKQAQFVGVSILNKDDKKIRAAINGEPLKLRLEILNHGTKTIDKCSVSIGIKNFYDQMLIGLRSDVLGTYFDIKPGINTVTCEIPRLPLSENTYKYNVALYKSNVNLDWLKEVGTIEVVNGLFFPEGKVPASGQATVLVDQKWY